MGIDGTSIKKVVCPDPVWKPVSLDPRVPSLSLAGGSGNAPSNYQFSSYHHDSYQ